MKPTHFSERLAHIERFPKWEWLSSCLWALPAAGQDRNTPTTLDQDLTRVNVKAEYKKYLLPDDFIKFTLEEWIDYTGAEYYDSEW